MFRYKNEVRDKKYVKLLFYIYFLSLLIAYFFNLSNIRFTRFIIYHRGFFGVVNLNIGETLYFYVTNTNIPMIYRIRNLFFPILAWINMGIFYKLLFSKNNNFIFFLKVTLSITFIYVIRVLFRLGIFDIDKIIMNILGVYIGILVYKIYTCYFKKN